MEGAAVHQDVPERAAATMLRNDLPIAQRQAATAFLRIPRNAHPTLGMGGPSRKKRYRNLGELEHHTVLPKEASLEKAYVELHLEHSL